MGICGSKDDPSVTLQSPTGHEQRPTKLEGKAPAVTNLSDRPDQLAPAGSDFQSPPRQCSMHTYKESIYMGDCKLPLERFVEILVDMMREWVGTDYDLLRKNCCIFSDALCIALGVGPIPK